MIRKILFCLFIMFIPYASANFMVYPVSTVLPGDGSSVIRVYSKSGDILYIKSRVVKIINPGTPEEKEVNVSNWQENGIIVSPARIIVPAGENRAVRLTHYLLRQKKRYTGYILKEFLLLWKVRKMPVCQLTGIKKHLYH